METVCIGRDDDTCEEHKIRMNKIVGGTECTPLQEDTTNFLNRYASEAVDYFLDRLNEPEHFTRFIDIIKSEARQPLREKIAKTSDKIIAHAFPLVIQNPHDADNSAGMPSVTSSGDTLVSVATDKFVGV